MNKSLFFYDLPESLIAQHPLEQRDMSRLMCLNRSNGEISEMVFHDIRDLLNPGDLLVVNDSKVIPARLYGNKADTNASVEVLLLRDLGDDKWDTIVRPGKRIHTGTKLTFGDGKLTAEVLSEGAEGKREIRFLHDKSQSFYAILDEIGQTPLPHYIKEPVKDSSRYQTVYANLPGSAAAPTAGLHFTEQLLGELQDNGVGLAKITLHVGLGTFRPVKEDEIENHLMHEEFFTVSEQAAKQINETKEKGGRVIAVGTTSCRTLEAVYQKYGKVVPCSESTSIFIYPGYKFGVLDGLITNFHLPESTLIMLVSAFAGYELTMRAYKKAVEDKFRFYSFGDAMFIV